jgi:hypothetical protein
MSRTAEGYRGEPRNKPPFPVAIELDPRRASSVLELTPPQQVEAVTRELVRRHEHVAMGRFVGHLSDAALKAALGVMDNETLLRVGFVLEDKDRLERLPALLPKPRVTGIILAAARANLWLEAFGPAGTSERYPAERDRGRRTRTRSRCL